MALFGLLKTKAQNFKEKGVISLFVVVIVVGIVTVIAVGTSVVSSREMGFSSNINNSIIAFYAAESGTEAALYDTIKLSQDVTKGRCAGTCNELNAVCCTEVPPWNEVAGGSKYCISVTETLPCDYTTITKIQAIGEYKNTKRSIEVAF